MILLVLATQDAASPISFSFSLFSPSLKNYSLIPMPIQLNNLSIGYQNKILQKDIHFALEKSSCIALIGPNGSGKSTLLKTCAGLLPPRSGEVYVHGKNINTYTPKELAKHIAYVPQNLSALPEFTVLDFVLQGLGDPNPLFKFKTPRIQENKALELIETFHISELAHTTLPKLSGGQRQLALLAAAMAQNPNVLLLDEPTSALDPKNTVQLINLLQFAQIKYNLTIILATHDINLVTHFATHFLLLSTKQSPLLIPYIPTPELLELYFETPFEYNNTHLQPILSKETPNLSEFSKIQTTHLPSKKCKKINKISTLSVRKFSFISIIVFLLSIIISPFIGHILISPQDLFYDPISLSIFLNFRLGRLLWGLFAGASLAIVGASFQALLQNPLATPYTLGLANGSALGTLLALTLGFTSPWSIPLFAFLGALLSIVVVLPIARRLGLQQHTTLLLSGVAWSLFTSALSMLLQAFAPPLTAQQMLRWQMGSLDIAGFETLPLFLPIVLMISLLFTQTPALNAISIDPELAQTRGFHVRTTQILTFLSASIIVALIVSVTGPIAFVGLIIPHIIRKFTGPNTSLLFCHSLLLGSAFLILADTLARSLETYGTLPVGILTALLGAPALIAILFHKEH